ncbi:MULTISPECIES: hypothetical protein [unclassified Streptomyces]|uniref:hypothetical protein n=1 Tax=unclassified Streptomyces TaxID=2593676 RepID=UPI003D740866
MLPLTDAGRETLAQVAESRRTAFRQRSADRPARDLARFGRYLVRYNAWPPGDFGPRTATGARER